MKLKKIKILSMLALTTPIYAGSAFAQTSPDVYAVAERKLEQGVPLAEHSSFDDQAAWFDLHREIMMFSSADRAKELLSKLDFTSKSAGYSLDLSASWIAEQGYPDKAMAFLSQVGLEKPLSITGYKSFIDGWIKHKQPERAMQLIALDKNAKNYYLPTVLSAYRETPDQAAALYQEHYGNQTMQPYTQLKMLLAIAENYRAARDVENTQRYADQAWVMFEKGLKERNIGGGNYQDYLTLMDLYVFIDDKTKAQKVLANMLLATGNKGSNYNYALPGLLAFYKKIGLTSEYNKVINKKIALVDKIFGFAPSQIEEIALIRLLSSLDEVSLMSERIDKFMRAAEYTCYDDYYCYEYKIEALKHLYTRQQNTLADSYFNIIAAESQDQTFNPWATSTQHIVKKLAEIGRQDEAKALVTHAEEIYLTELKDYPEKQVTREYMDLADMYAYAGDTASAERILSKHAPTYLGYYMTSLYARNQEWDKVRAFVVQDKQLAAQNLQLLQNICSENTPECQQHITFTLNALTMEEPLSAEDTAANQQLYQIGAIYYTLGIKPNAEQQRLIQQLYDKALVKNENIENKL